MQSLIKLRPRVAHILDVGTPLAKDLAAGKASGDGWLDPAQSQDIDIDRVKTGDLLVIRAASAYRWTASCWPARPASTSP